MTTTPSLSPPERKFILSLAHFIDENGHSPSLRELGKRLGYLNVSSPQMIQRRLMARGLVSHVAGQPRTLRLAKGVVVHRDEIYMTVEVDA